MSAVNVQYVVPDVLPQTPLQLEAGSKLCCIPVVSNDSAEDKNSIWASKSGDKHEDGLENEAIASWEDNKFTFPYGDHNNKTHRMDCTSEWTNSPGEKWDLFFMVQIGLEEE